MLERYQRQELLPEFKDKAALLNQKKVGIIGLGGLGGICSLLLAGAGVLHLRLCEQVEVELTNLHRQIPYREDNVGQSKLECACRELRRLDSRVELETVPHFMDEQSFPGFCAGLDLILDLTDNFASRRMLSRLCYTYKKDYIQTTVQGYAGTMAAYLFSDPEFARKYGCYECILGDDSPIPNMGITGPSAAAMGAQTALLALRCLTGDRSFAGYLIRCDLWKHEVRRLRLTPNPSCPICHGAP